MTPEQYRVLRLQIAAQLCVTHTWSPAIALQEAERLISANEARPVPQEVKP